MLWLMAHRAQDPGGPCCDPDRSEETGFRDRPLRPEEEGGEMIATVELRLGSKAAIRRQLQKDCSRSRRVAACCWGFVSFVCATCCIWLVGWRGADMDGSEDEHSYLWLPDNYTDTQVIVNSTWNTTRRHYYVEAGYEMTPGGPGFDWPVLLLWLSVGLAAVEAVVAGVYLGAVGHVDPLRPGWALLLGLALVDSASSTACWLAASQCQAGVPELEQPDGSSDGRLDGATDGLGRLTRRCHWWT